MKKHTILLCAVAVLLMLSGLVLAQATFTIVNGITETIVAIPNPGEVTCHGAAPTGNLLMPCPPGVGGTLRGRQSIAMEVSSDPRLSGLSYLTVNMNIRPDGTVRMWGTFRMEAAGGTWEGIWEGKNSTEGLSYRATGHGRNGEVDGLQLLWEATYPPNSLSGTATARILAPGK